MNLADLVLCVMCLFIYDALNPPGVDIYISVYEI